MGSVLVSPLNWGLGHAMRDVPVIRTLIDRGHEVTIAACGNSLAALQREFPDCRFIRFEDYPAPYSSGRLFLPKLALYFPLLLKAVAQEREESRRIISRGQYDLIISDNRLGVYSPQVPSLFITHQIHYNLSPLLWPLALLTSALNRFHHRRFDRIIIPDNPPGPLSLAGKLSRTDSPAERLRTYYAGIMTSIPRRESPCDLDYLVLISGPEPQRTQLEKILLPQVRDLEGESVVLLGSPQQNPDSTSSGQCSIRTYVSNEEKAALMNRARCIICRSGYTTMMEIAELQKRAGLFIPTPGQPEQEYLSSYYQRNGWFFSRSQYLLNLTEDLRIARDYYGFPQMSGTEENMRRLYKNVLAEYVE